MRFSTSKVSIYGAKSKYRGVETLIYRCLVRSSTVEVRTKSMKSRLHNGLYEVCISTRKLWPEDHLLNTTKASMREGPSGDEMLHHSQEHPY